MKTRLAVCVLLLGGCTVGPDFHAPAAPDTQTYTRSASPALPIADHALPQWWKQFASDALNRLVDEALRNSPTVAQARARLTQAREDYRAQAGAAYYPAVDASLSGSRQKVDPAAFGVPVPSPGPFTLYDASVNVTYSLDLFGGDRRALEALRAQVDYQAFELDAARLSIAGNVVSTAIRRASLQARITLTQGIVDAQAQQLSIMEARMTAGGVSRFDVRSQRTLVEQTRASLPALLAERDAADHRLAILLGVEPSNADFDALTLDTLRVPDDVPLTLPSTLARERPDIRASEALLHQANANVGVATADLYPKFSLSASAGSQRTNIHDMFDRMNVWNIGLGLSQPLFRGGELRARKRSAEAARDAATSAYRETVLGALQQVADALTALQNDAHAVRARDIAANEAQANLATARARFTAGGVSRFDMLDTQRQALQTQLDRTIAHASRLADTAALFQALGGIESETMNSRAH
ncbi:MULTISPECIES: efflux transporter outer membrane subunit [unclassified Caballeronia]|uniref:efflux transporter outer membrane subunit n=1 Tax=unclassified Caballeronia TaxID=2646786 RepID=UPI00286146CE|nr:MULTISPECIES: efflux transporter outer membrane subunit [unclassified Caballeronia]MDR5739909.1 efflux transporter outer membrane subunit [Caballeronia sp. LZ016]MDR5808375.1 efflux transporter outer membrane subunit [Caballeronia sp. LZ019]